MDVNEGRTDVPEPTKPVYETMLLSSSEQSNHRLGCSLGMKALPNGPQLNSWWQLVILPVTKPVTSTEAKPKGEALAEAPSPENALTLSEGLTSASNSKEVVGDVPTPDNAWFNATWNKV